MPVNLARKQAVRDYFPLYLYLFFLNKYIWPHVAISHVGLTNFLSRAEVQYSRGVHAHRLLILHNLVDKQVHFIINLREFL